LPSILTHKNKKEEELPIAFTIKTFHDYELNCSMIEKRDLSMVKAIAHLGTYI